MRREISLGRRSRSMAGGPADERCCRFCQHRQYIACGSPAHGRPYERASNGSAAVDRSRRPRWPASGRRGSRIYREVLTPAHDFSLHQLLYTRCYAKHHHPGVPEPAWLPDESTIATANVTAVAESLGLPDYAALYRWSVENREAYWQLAIERLGIRFQKPFDRMVDLAEPTRPRWFPGGAMNIVDSCFQADDDAPAIIELAGHGETRICTYGELRQMTARVANGLAATGIKPGDAIAIVMPMTSVSVAIYLGIIAAGATVVSIADSFAAEEIAVRLRLSAAKRVFTQDAIAWGSKRLPLFEKIAAADAPPAIVLSTSNISLRNGDCLLNNFLSEDTELWTAPCDPQAAINILFSSGTTGTPKAIPWDHTTPIKCAADAHFHQDLHPGDVACWPTKPRLDDGAVAYHRNAAEPRDDRALPRSTHRARVRRIRTASARDNARPSPKPRPQVAADRVHEGARLVTSPRVQFFRRMLQSGRHALPHALGWLSPDHRILRRHGDRRRLSSRATVVHPPLYSVGTFNTRRARARIVSSSTETGENAIAPTDDGEVVFAFPRPSAFRRDRLLHRDHHDAMYYRDASSHGQVPMVKCSGGTAIRCETVASAAIGAWTWARGRHA